MKRRLRGGAPYVGLAVHAGTKVFRCQCQSQGCRDKTVVLEGSTSPISGHWVGTQELASHKAADINLQNRQKNVGPKSATTPKPAPDVTHGNLASAQSTPQNLRRAQKALTAILTLQTQFNVLSQRSVPAHGLVFKQPPIYGANPNSTPGSLAVNSGPYALSINVDSNSQLLAFELDLWEFLSQLDHCSTKGDAGAYLQLLRSSVEEKFQELQDVKTAEWIRQSQLSQEGDPISSGSHIQLDP